MIDRIKFGNNLKAARKTVKQRVIAEKANIKAQNLSNYETGKRLPPLEDLVTLADILDCSIDELLGRDRPKANNEKVITLGDLMRVIDWQYFIGDLQFGTIDYVKYFNDEEGWPSKKDSSCPSIGLTIPQLEKFIDAYQKMADLKKQGAIDHDIFNQWLEGQASKNDIVVLYDFDPELPF